MKWNRWSGLGLALLASFALACSDDGPTNVTGSPLSGLTQAQQKDSTGTLPPAPPSQTGPGRFHGTVLGPSAPGAGNDSLATAPRVAGVRVTAYPRVGPSTGNNGLPEIGPAAGTVTTGSDGKFVFPTIPGGEYVVTFTPPDGSIYGGVWVTTTVHASSDLYPWWVVLWRK